MSTIYKTNTIGNIISRLCSANRLYADARQERNTVLKRIWQEERIKLEAELADMGIVVEHPERVEEEVA